MDRRSTGRPRLELGFPWDLSINSPDDPYGWTGGNVSPGMRLDVGLGERRGLFPVVSFHSFRRGASEKPTISNPRPPSSHTFERLRNRVRSLSPKRRTSVRRKLTPHV